MFIKTQINEKLTEFNSQEKSTLLNSTNSLVFRESIEIKLFLFRGDFQQIFKRNRLVLFIFNQLTKSCVSHSKFHSLTLQIKDSFDTDLMLWKIVMILYFQHSKTLCKKLFTPL